MAVQITVSDSIEMLPDGKIKGLIGAVETIVQPEAEVRLEGSTMLKIQGKYAASIYVDTTITQINNVAFSGTFTDLDLLVSELVKDANSTWRIGRSSANHPSQQELTNPSTVVIDDWNKIDFACAGTITVTIDGNSIIYPYTLGSSTILGASFEADSGTENPITFNGTGTVLINIKK